MGHKVLDWLAWYPLDFWGSLRVLRLSEAACNLYRWMLDYQWVHGAVPDDPLVVTRLYPWGEAAANSWTAVRPLFDVVDGQLVNRRMAEIAEEAAGLMESWSVGGRRSAETRRARYGTAAPNPHAKSVPKSAPKSTRTQDRTGQDRTGQDNQKQPSAAAASPSLFEKPETLPAVKKPRAEPTGPDADFRRWWCAAFEKQTGTAYAWDFGKDSKLLSGLLKRAKLEEIQQRATRLLIAPPEWLVDGGVDIGTLHSQFNRLASAGQLTASNPVRDLALRNPASAASQQPSFLPRRMQKRLGAPEANP